MEPFIQYEWIAINYSEEKMEWQNNALSISLCRRFFGDISLAVYLKIY